MDQLTAKLKKLENKTTVHINKLKVNTTLLILNYTSTTSKVTHTRQLLVFVQRARGL